MTADRAAIDVLLNPKSVAIVGASRNPRRMSGVIVHQIKKLGFTGEVYPINPQCDEIAGLRCYPSLGDLRGTAPDVAVLYLPAEQAVAAAREAAEMGVRGLIVLSAGFAELGGRGQHLQNELTEICRNARIAVMGPNTAGMANFNAGFVAYGSTGFAGLETFRAGGVAIMSSSGGLGSSLFAYCQARELGVSHLLGIGNEGVTTAASYLDALVRDPQVQCITALLEAIREPADFLAAADRAVDAGKPVVLMKQGRSAAGQRSIQNHTGAFGGEYATLVEACRAHGVVVVSDLQSLIDQAMLFVRTPVIAPGYRAGVFSLPGGGTSLMADAATDAGIELPALAESTVSELREVLPPIATPSNPADPTAGFSQNPERLAHALNVFGRDPSFDVLVFFQCTVEPRALAEVGQTLLAVARRLGKPVVCVWDSGSDREHELWSSIDGHVVAMFDSAGACFRAMRRHREWTRFAARRATPEAADFGPLATDPCADPLPGPDVGHADAESVLDSLGIVRPRQGLAVTSQQAAAIAAQIGCPVALKLARPAVDHKTELGGVRLGVRGATEAAAAFDAVVANVEAALGTGTVEAVLVQEMVPDGVEVLVGVHPDPQFGSVVTVAHGGLLTELLNDAQQRLAPLSRAAATEMIEQLRCYPLLRGYRGASPADVGALVDVVLRLAWAAHHHPELAVELNPVVVRPTGGGAVAVDWAMTPAETGSTL